MPPFYYDAAFHKEPNFQVPFYKSSYYPTWLVVVDRLHRYGCNSILDVGCGPGQFAALIEDAGFSSYTGLDFSSVAIQMAQARTPGFQFRAGDVRQKTTYEGLTFDAIVCMEVLEHIEEDLAVLSCFPPGTRCLMTVPNFPWRSHVRHFESEEAVRHRYGEFFQELTVTRLKGVRTDTEQFYLLDGVRNKIVREASDLLQTS
jgi:SAM-dependent methyltransferase